MQHVEDIAPAAKGHLQLWVRRNGVIVPELCIDEPNLIVNGSKTCHSRLIGGTTANMIVTKIGFGTSATAANVADTALTGLFAKALDAVTFPASNSVKFDFSLASGENNGVAISEFGLLTANNTLYSRKTRSTPLNKDTDISFTGSWTITF